MPPPATEISQLHTVQNEYVLPFLLGAMRYCVHSVCHLLSTCLFFIGGPAGSGEELEVEEDEVEADGEVDSNSIAGQFLEVKGHNVPARAIRDWQAARAQHFPGFMNFFPGYRDATQFSGIFPEILGWLVGMILKQWLMRLPT